MALPYLLLFPLFIGCQSVDELHVWSSPSYIKFVATDKSLEVSQIPHLLQILFGLSPPPNFLWDGLLAGNPFRHPEAIVILEIPSLELDSMPQSYKIINDCPTVEINDVLIKLEELFPNDQPIFINANSKQTLLAIKNEQPELLKSLPDEFSDGEDSDIQVIDALTNELSKQKSILRNGIPDVFFLHLPLLKELKKLYGTASENVVNARSLLKTSLSQFRNTLEKIYDGDILFLLLSRQEEIVERKTRSILAVATEEKNINLAPYYSRNYAVVFNLLLWTMVTLAVTVFAITVFIWHMDPGRDSIIYRMTSQRMKKE